MQMKTAISIPDPVFRAAEHLAARLGVSRSELYCRALRELIGQHEEAAITDKLNQVYGSPEGSSGLDPQLAMLQSRSISKER